MKSLQIGSIFDDKYKILSVLGEGATGTVYQASELELGREVAIKTLNLWSGSDEQASGLKRFKQEAKVLCGLNHANIVQVYRFGESPQPFIVAELAEGQSLREILDKKGKLRYALALEIALQLSEALAYAHKHGVIHRDVKPENIMVKIAEGKLVQLKLIDFGLCKAEIASSGSLTGAGQFVGTALYISPEQVKGGNLDARADIYSFGILLFEMLAGYPPLRAASLPETLLQHLNQDPPRLFELAPQSPLLEDLDQLIQESCKKDPEKRLQSAEQLSQQLKQLIDKQIDGIFEPQKGSAAKKLAAWRKSPYLTMLFCLLLFLPGLAAAYFIYHSSAAPEQSMEVSLSAVSALLKSKNFSSAYDLACKNTEAEYAKRWPPLQQAALSYKYFELFKEVGEQKFAQDFLLRFMKLAIPAHVQAKESDPEFDKQVKEIESYLMSAHVPRSLWKALQSPMEQADQILAATPRITSDECDFFLRELKNEACFRGWVQASRDEASLYCRRMCGLAYGTLGMKRPDFFERVIKRVLELSEQHDFKELLAQGYALRAENALREGKLDQALKFMERCDNLLEIASNSEDYAAPKESFVYYILETKVKLYSRLEEQAEKDSKTANNADAKKYAALKSRYKKELAAFGETLSEQKTFRKGVFVDMFKDK